MPTVIPIDDLHAGVGDHLGHCRWLTITQEQVDRFADATGDHQWIHVDPQRATPGPFGGPIAPPVPVGAQLRMGVTLTGVEEVSGGVQATLETVFEVHDAPKPSCVAEVVDRFYR